MSGYTSGKTHSDPEPVCYVTLAGVRSPNRTGLVDLVKHFPHMYVYAPRPEYDNHNPILVGFRDDLNTARDPERDSDVIADWINALAGDDSGLSVFMPVASPAQDDHARRVLEKLATLTTAPNGVTD